MYVPFKVQTKSLTDHVPPPYTRAESQCANIHSLLTKSLTDHLSSRHIHMCQVSKHVIGPLSNPSLIRVVRHPYICTHAHSSSPSFHILGAWHIICIKHRHQANCWLQPSPWQSSFYYNSPIIKFLYKIKVYEIVFLIVLFISILDWYRHLGFIDGSHHHSTFTHYR